jgi:hypothetical protein
LQFRKKLEGWHRNRYADIKKEKTNLISELDRLDRLAEQQSLESQDRARRKELNEKLEVCWKIEEIKARQRSRDKEIKERDRNTSYFFAKANQRRRNNAITQLEDNGVIFSDNFSMMNHAKEFYKNLFGFEPRSNIKLDGDFWEENEVSSEDNEILEFEFSEAEIKKAIEGSYAEGASGFDDFSFLFYQRFWPIIKDDLMAMVKIFEEGEMSIARLNYAMIILIPKEDGTKYLKIFRPISLLNCSFKIFAKAINNRLEGM